MRLWKRAQQVCLQIKMQLDRQVAFRRTKTASDADTRFIRDLMSKGAPMSLASVKAALDATAALPPSVTGQPRIHHADSLLVAMAGLLCTLFV